MGIGNGGSGFCATAESRGPPSKWISMRGVHEFAQMGLNLSGFVHSVYWNFSARLISLSTPFSDGSAGVPGWIQRPVHFSAARTMSL